MSEQVTPEGHALTKPHRKLVAIRSSHNLAMLKTRLDETDLETTEVVVLVADAVPLRAVAPTPGLSQADRELLTAVVSRGVSSNGYCWRIRLRLLDSLDWPSQRASSCPASGQTARRGNSPTVSIATHTP
jgi:hypothetical protein